MKTKQLAINQLDKQLAKWRATKLLFQPKNGWVKTIRKALGVTTRQL